MKKESVRLVHAQGVPNHYIANQIYQPVDEDHRKRGSFVILLEQSQTSNGSFVASLINTLVREYYRQPGHDLLTAFEHTLIRLNEQIKHYLRSTDAVSANLNGCVVLVTEDEIHISYIGTPSAYLVRDGDLLNLVDSTETKSQPTFSVITSGEMQVNDVLSLATGLPHPAGIEDDLRFALTHTPLYEVGRAFARLLKQKHARSAEALFYHFNESSEETTQVYVDRALETTPEKLDHYKRKIATHGTLVLSGAQFLSDRVRKAAEKHQHLKVAPLAETPDFQDTAIPEELEAPAASSVATAVETESYDSAGFAVKTYWHGAHEEDTTTPASTATYEAPAPSYFRSPARFAPTSFLQQLRHLNPRTGYILLGLILLLIIATNVINNVVKNSPNVNQTTEQRDAILGQAETAAREADAAQIQDNIALAIEKTMRAKTLLAELPESSQNERSKTLTTRVAQTFATLTKATTLKATETPADLPTEPIKVVSTLNGTYVFSNTSVTKSPQASLQLDTLFPKNVTILDAVAYDGYQKIAVAVKTSDNKIEMHSITTVNDQVSLLKRSDNKDWPATKQLASFETNLYFIENKMFKGTAGKDNTYRVVAYANNDDTSKVTHILNNGFAFYALENGKQLVRIAANTSKTPVKLYGVPETFLPKTIDQLISTRQEGTLYLFDKAEQRILHISTDGAYRQQFLLPKEHIFTTCDASEKEFLCTTTKKQLITIPIAPAA